VTCCFGVAEVVAAYAFVQIFTGSDITTTSLAAA